MIFGISDQDLMDKNKIKIINGIAGSGKSTQTVSELKKLGSNFCLASFSNALKFAAADKFGCATDTICGLEFVNSPYPRSDEREVTEFDTVINDEILLDGLECINWMKHNVGKINIIALTDSRQMLSADNSDAVIKAFNRLCKLKNVICVEVNQTKRARNSDTVKMYDDLYKLESNQLFTINQVKDIFNCDVIDFDTISYCKNNTFICHSNRIEHEIYKRYDLNNDRTNVLIPKNHIARNRKVDYSKYPICDQITATEKKLNAYLQVANVATPTRFQGKEVEVGDQLYFVIEEDSLFTGREIYTVGTRCQDMKSIHIAIIKVADYKDPDRINGMKIVSAQRLDIPDHDKTFKSVSNSEMAEILKEHGKPGTYYYHDIITSGDSIIYSTLSDTALRQFADINVDKGVVTYAYHKKLAGARKSIRSMVKKDTSLHFDFMPRVYEIVGNDINAPRICNPKGCRKDQFEKLCDVYSAFPTILHNCTMPAAGFLYEEYDPDLLNFYVYEGSIVTKGSIITEELANKIGDSRYVFSTNKQDGCSIGHYTYEQCKKSKEAKKNINKNFLWGILQSDYYQKEIVVVDGETSMKYVKHRRNNLELVSCALWSALCCVMLDAIKSIKAKKFVVVTDGLYYSGEKNPDMPKWCDYRIEDKEMERLIGKDEGEKYSNIIEKTYEDLPDERERRNAIKRERMRQQRASMSEEEKAEKRKKDAERKRIARAKKKEQ